MYEQTLRDTPMQRFGTLGELAAAIAFLAADEASYITGQTLYVAGGGVG
ncbi:MAG: SDR family oxidoreductase [Porticoccaceae bacterium]